MTAMTDTADTSTSIAPLWGRVRAMWARVLAALNGPAVVAAIACITPQLYRDMVRRIAPLEHAVRKLLLVEAVKYAHLQVSRPRKLPTAHGGVAPARGIAPDLSRPETWRAQFALSPPRDPLLVPESRAPRIRTFEPFTVVRPMKTTRRVPAPAISRSLRLARRLEALRRVIAEPAPYARRLARHFAGVRRRYPDAAFRYAAASPRGGGFESVDPRLGIECQVRALDAAPAFANSS